MRINFYNDMLRAADGAGGAGDGTGENKGAGQEDNKDAAGAGTGGNKAGEQKKVPGAEEKPWYDGNKFITEDPVRLTIAKKYTSVEAALQAGISAQQMVGVERIALPKGEADWENVYNALGRPADAAGYDIKAPTDLPEGLEYNKDLENDFRAAAHKAGLNNKQAVELQKFWMGFASNMHVNGQKAYATERATAENELKRDLGAAYDGHVAVAKAALETYADPKFIEFLESSGYGNHPEIVRIFGKIGRETLGEEKLKGLNKGDVGLTPAELDAQIAEHRSKYNEALYNKMHPDHQVATDKLTELMKRKFPDKKEA